VKFWITATVATALLFFAVALSQEIYDATSPPTLSWHVLLRKAYSVAAFAVVGFCQRKALGTAVSGGRALAACTLGVALYSATIEVAQRVAGSSEGLGWNAIDVACGAAGGALGALAGSLTRRTREPLQR